MLLPNAPCDLLGTAARERMLAVRSLVYHRAQGSYVVGLLGYLGGHGKIKEFPDQTSVGEVSVATDCSVQDSNGAWRERTEWHSVVMSGAAAAAVVPKRERGST